MNAAAKAASFIPGFDTADSARAAGKKFYRKMSGALGRDGVDFHVVMNDYGRWHFAPGRLPTKVD